MSSSDWAGVIISFFVIAIAVYSVRQLCKRHCWSTIFIDKSEVSRENNQL